MPSTFQLIAISYLAVLLGGAVASFKTRRSRFRIAVRFATVLLFIPGLLLGILTAFFWEAEPPSLVELQYKFPQRRSNLERLVQMSTEDEMIPRIAPDWLDRRTSTPSHIGMYNKGEPNSGLSDARWNLYRTIFDRNGIKLGLQRDEVGDVFIMADSIGLLNRGHITGYLYCAPSDSNNPNRHQPCILHQEKGSHQYDPDHSSEAYSFEKVAEHWYVYDEGPS